MHAKTPMKVEGWSDTKKDWSIKLKKFVDSITIDNSIAKIALDKTTMNPAIIEVLNNMKIEYMSPEFIQEMRSVKDEQDINVMRGAGQVAISIMEGIILNLREGVEEWSLAQHAISKGSKRAAELLNTPSQNNSLYSPLIHNSVPILQSGPPTGENMLCVHNRATTRKIRTGDCVQFCCCNVAEFKLMKLGFDRTIYLGQPSDDIKELYEIMVGAQKAALDTIKPGIRA